MKSAFYFSAILAVSLTSYCAFRCSFNENFMGEEKRRFFKYLLSITIHHLSFIPSYEYFVSNMRNRRKSNAFQAFNRWWKSFSSLRNLNHFVRTHSLWCVPRLSLPRSYCDQFFLQNSTNFMIIDVYKFENDLKWFIFGWWWENIFWEYFFQPPYTLQTFESSILMRSCFIVLEICENQLCWLQYIQNVIATPVVCERVSYLR